MMDIRIHGRGGQGAVLASEILAVAAFREGYSVQSFPFFGVERRGAPVTAYTRIDDRPIRIRSNVYEPDHVVVLDASLLRVVNVTEGLRRHGTVLLNAEHRPPNLADANMRVAFVNATDIALKHGLGSKTAPVVNTAILGAFVRLVRIASLEGLMETIADKVPAAPDRNVAAAREAYEAVRMMPEVIA